MSWMTNGDIEKQPESCGTCGGCGRIRELPSNENRTCPSCGGSGKK